MTNTDRETIQRLRREVGDLTARLNDAKARIGADKGDREIRLKQRIQSLEAELIALRRNDNISFLKERLREARVIGEKTVTNVRRLRREVEDEIFDRDRVRSLIHTINDAIEHGLNPEGDK